MAKLEHSLRVERLMRGGRNVTDLDRLFGDLRFAKPGRDTVREIGDFAAHRDERDKGIVMRRAGDMQTSARIWVRQQFGIVPSIEDLRAAGFANLNIATDEQISRRLAVTKQVARSQLIQGLKHFARGERLSKKQRAAVNYLGTSFIWLYAFDDITLAGDLADVLIETDALEVRDRAQFLECRSFIALHAITLMQGSLLKLPDGQAAPLQVAIREETGTLCVKAEIPVVNMGKPISCVAMVFETSLKAAVHCSTSLLDDPQALSRPLEVDASGQLSLIS